MFDEIELWEASDIPTSVLNIHAKQESDSAEFTDLFDSEEMCAEDVGLTTRVLCQECSEGRPFEDHGHPAEIRSTDRLFYVAGPPDKVERLVATWENGGPDRDSTLLGIE